MLSVCQADAEAKKIRTMVPGLVHVKYVTATTQFATDFESPLTKSEISAYIQDLDCTRICGVTKRPLLSCIPVHLQHKTLTPTSTSTIDGFSEALADDSRTKGVCPQRVCPLSYGPHPHIQDRWGRDGPNVPE